MEISTALVLTIAALLVSIPNVAARSLTYDLSYSLPVVFVFVALVVIIAVIVCVLYRAKRGYFCCLSPRPIPMRRRNVENGTTATSTQPNGSSAHTTTTAPNYHTVPTNANIAPPDYVDALHDVVVPEEGQQAPPEYSGNTTQSADEPASEQQVGLTDDSTESYDDTTPLNP